jgi:HK97 family phage major capsid protein
MSLKQFTALSAILLAGAGNHALANGAGSSGPQRPLHKPSFGVNAIFGPAPLTLHEAPDDAVLLKAVRDAGDQMKTLTTNVDNWQKENKKALEDLTTAKNKHADDFDLLNKSLKQVQLAMHRERMMMIGNPVQRISADEEQRTLLNAIVRTMTKQPLNASQNEVMKALAEGSSPGSLGLVTALNKNIYDLLPDYGIWNTLAVEPVGTLTTNFVVDTVDPIAQFIDEAGAIADDTNIAGTSVAATVKKIAVLVKISRELLQDSEFDVTGRLLVKIARAIAYRFDFAAFRADGTADATNGGATGVFNFGTVYTAASGNTTMETLDFEDFTSTIMTPDVAALSRMCRWWMHPHILVRCLHVKDSNGRPIFLTAIEAPTPGAVGSILGFPVTLGNALPNTNSAGNKMAAFGDPDAFVVAPRQATEIAQSEHIYFPNDQVAVRGIARAGFKGRKATGLALLKTAAS